MEIADVLAMYNDALMAAPGVVGTAIGVCDGAPCIRVFVLDSEAPVRSGIPRSLEGFPVRFELSGAFWARFDELGA